jgi:hypothetical protein
MSSYIRRDGEKSRQGQPVEVRMVKVSDHTYVNEIAAKRLGLIANDRAQ